MTQLALDLPLPAEPAPPVLAVVPPDPAPEAAPAAEPEAEWVPLPEPGHWSELALCSETDPEAFFPEKGGSTREAKRICAMCEVREECLRYALDNDERFGVWGGLTERERRRIKKRSV